MDDILIHSKTREDHLLHIKLVFTAFQKENVKLKISKCKFFKQMIEYSGHRLKPGEILPLNDNVESITKFPKPEKKKSLQRLLGKINYYRKFIPNITEILAPLYNLLRKDTPFQWDSKCARSFEKIKKILTSEPNLKIYDPNKQGIFQCDASRVRIGAVLKQRDEKDVLHPISYFSKKLLPYQINYSISELECLAVAEALDY